MGLQSVQKREFDWFRVHSELVWGGVRCGAVVGKALGDFRARFSRMDTDWVGKGWRLKAGASGSFLWYSVRGALAAK